MKNYSTGGQIVTVNGRTIKDWGESDPAFTHEGIDENVKLRRGQGGGGIRLDRINPGRKYVLNLNPGSSDSGYIQGLLNRGVDITISSVQIGTLEGSLGREGAISADGPVGRAGQSITDDNFTINCNLFNQTKGGI